MSDRLGFLGKNLLPCDGSIYYIPHFFSPQESEQYLLKLQNNINWIHEPITIFGKKIMQPRLTFLTGDEGKSYTYSGTKMFPAPWGTELLQIKSRVEEKTQYNFTTALLNLYRNNLDSMGWHQDNEKELGVNPVIASVSFGETRKFKLKHINKNLTLDLDLENGSLLLMADEIQHFWKHSLPKVSRNKGIRINITFRKIIF